MGQQKRQPSRSCPPYPDRQGRVRRLQWQGANRVDPLFRLTDKPEQEREGPIGRQPVAHSLEQHRVESLVVGALAHPHMHPRVGRVAAQRIDLDAAQAGGFIGRQDGVGERLALLELLPMLDEVLQVLLAGESRMRPIAAEHGVQQLN